MDSVTDDGFLCRRVSPFGNLRIDAYVPLPGAYRSLSRPSSAPDAKAFPLCSFSLNLLVLKNYAGSIRFPSVEIAFTQFASNFCLLLPSCLLSLFSFQCAGRRNGPHGLRFRGYRKGRENFACIRSFLLFKSKHTLRFDGDEGYVLHPLN